MIEENCFWWVLLWDCFVVDSVFFLHVVASVLAGGKVVQCLIWFEVVFLFIWWFFFNDLMKYNHGFFLWDFLCLVSLRRGRFFSCWFVKKVFVEWIGLFVDWVVGEFVFFSDSNFFFNGIKKNFIVWKKFFYVSFFHSS